METVEANKIIAKFMGFEDAAMILGGGNIMRKPTEFKYGCQQYEEYPYDKLLYHSDWNWLMLAVDKISRLKIGDDIKTVEYAYPYTFGVPDLLSNEMMFRLNGFSLHKAETLIEAAFKGVLDFINWYNQNKVLINQNK